MSDFQCPFCSSIMPVMPYTAHTQTPSFEHSSGFRTLGGVSSDDESKLHVTFFKCPRCGEYSISVKGVGTKVSDIGTKFIRPLSLAKKFPTYIPIAIRQDYEEAYAIVSLSPKASATLSRRCIQGMIHDKWKIVLKNLNQEISALKDKIDPNLWSAIDSLRQIGNIGAHMEKDINAIVDIDSGEAEKLLKLVEILIKEWYIVPQERDELLSGIVQINTEKQNQRKKTE